MLREISLIMVIITSLTFILPNFIIAQENEENSEENGEFAVLDMESIVSNTIQNNNLLLASNDKWFCQNCGAENPPEAEFCQKCGLSKLQTETTHTVIVRYDSWWDNYWKWVVVLGIASVVATTVLILALRSDYTYPNLGSSQ